MDKFGVKCHLSHEVTLDTIEKEKPDVVILATGSTPVMPPVAGIDKPLVFNLHEILNGNQAAKKKTVIVGGGATGCEAAHHLSENGCSVTIVEQLPKIAGELESITRKVLISKLKENDVRIMTGYSLSRVEDTGVLVKGEDGTELFVESETVAIAVGNKPDNSLYEQIESMGIPVHQIGDCLEPRSAKAAISEGAVIGRAI